MKTVLITGSTGFIGRNLSATLEQDKEISLLHFNRSNSLEELDALIKQSDFIFHLAGVNRPKVESEFDQGNRELTERILKSITDSGRKVPILITSSVQAELDNPYGKSKKAAEDATILWSKENGSKAYVYRLPNVFGKWSAPQYNSVVATFCNNIAKGLDITINDPKTIITLVYIDDVVEEFIKVLKSSDKIQGEEFRSIPREFKISLDELVKKIYFFKNNRNDLINPNFEDIFDRFLFATFTSYLDQEDFGYNLEMKRDDRGWLAEFIKSHQFGQIFISRTKPGISRGNHWHHTKIEKFLVVEGEAEIKLRNYGTDKLVSYKVSGDDLKVVDMPAGYVHSIKNTGSKDLITIFWADEIFNPDKPDTYYLEV